MLCHGDSSASSLLSYYVKCPAWCPPSWREKWGCLVSVLELSLRHNPVNRKKIQSQFRNEIYALPLIWIMWEVLSTNNFEKRIKSSATPLNCVLLCLFTESWSQVPLNNTRGEDIWVKSDLLSLWNKHFPLRLILTDSPLS